MDLPTLFISHGSPMTALDQGPVPQRWRALGRQIDAHFGRPKAIVSVSAHSLAHEPTVLGAARHATVHDFYGFPAALYALRYDAPGAPMLAPRVEQLLRNAGLPARLSDAGGLDHGHWTPLRSMYPQADVPVLPLAWPAEWTPPQLFALGRALAPLAAEGVLVMASGAITHNLRWWAGGIEPEDAPERPQSAAFRQWMADHLARGDWDALFDVRQRAPHATLMHPTDEHLLPLFIAAGAAGDQPVGRRLLDHVTHGHLGMDVYAFGDGADLLAADPPPPH